MKIDKISYIIFKPDSFFKRVWTQDNYTTTRGEFWVTFWPYEFREVAVVKWRVKKVKYSYYLLWPYYKVKQLLSK